ncbi:MAG: (2Fe-2S)-binding protein [Oligoflexia bacterium]|nr:(2Fe-2S)-binding protein [Oligoflexia bacterium]
MEKVSRAEIPGKEWIEIKVTLDDQGLVKSVQFRAYGCSQVLEAAKAMESKLVGQPLSGISWDGDSHGDVLVREAIQKLQGRFSLPYTPDQELCHCRKIPASKVDQAILLGAKTPEKVKAWTSASSGCGTCRPDIESLIKFRKAK